MAFHVKAIHRRTGKDIHVVFPDLPLAEQEELMRSIYGAYSQHPDWGPVQLLEDTQKVLHERE